MGYLVPAGRLLALGGVLISNMQLARLLTQAEYGSFLLAKSIIGIAATVGMMGLDINLLRRVGVRLGKGDRNGAAEEMRSGLRFLAVSTAITVLVLSGICSMGVFGFLGFGTPGLFVIALAIPSAAQAFRVICADLLRSFDEWIASSLLMGSMDSAAGSCVFVLLVFALAEIGQCSLESVLLMQAVLSLATAAVALWMLVWRASRYRGGSSSLVPSAMSGRALLRETVPGFLINLQAYLFTQGDTWLAGMLSLGDVAIYGSARRLSSLLLLPLDLVTRPLMTSIPVLLTQGRVREQELILTRLTRISLLCAAPAVLLLTAFPQQVMEWTFGSGFGAGGDSLRILIWMQVVYLWSGCCGILLMMAGRQREVLVVQLAAGLAMLMAGPWAVRWGQMMGLAGFMLLLTLVQRGAFARLSVRLLGIHTTPRFRMFFRPRNDSQSASAAQPTER